MSFDATVLTMFPEAFPGPLGVSLIGTAWREKGLWALQTLDIRDFSEDKRGFLDDTPAGGGPGAVLKADVVARALNVRQTEKLVNDEGKARPTSGGRPANPAKDPDVAALERDLTQQLGCKVAIRSLGKGGELTISYGSLEQLDDILARLSREPDRAVEDLDAV